MGLIEQIVELQNLAVSVELLSQKIEQETCSEAEFDLWCQHDELLDGLSDHIRLMNGAGAFGDIMRVIASTELGQELVVKHAA